MVDRRISRPSHPLRTCEISFSKPRTQSKGSGFAISILFLFKSLTRKLQSSAVFGYRPHNIVRCAAGDFGFDFECHLYVGTDEAREM